MFSGNCEVNKKELELSGFVIGILAVGFLIASLYSATSIGIINDGETKVYTTFQKTFGGVLNEKGIFKSNFDSMTITTDDGNIISLGDKFINGTIYDVQKSTPISIQDGNKIFKVSTSVGDKVETARNHGIFMGLYDRFTRIEDPKNPGKMLDRIVRVEHRIVVEAVPVPYELLYEPNNRVEKGEIVIWKPGSGGEIEETYREIYEDGNIVSRELISTKTSKVAIHQVMAEGNAEFPPAYEKMMVMESTAYTPTVEECDGDPTTCSTGMKSGYGVVAIYPKEIPYYTELYIEGYGYAIAGDCGGAIRPGRIDVFFYDKESARKWGRRKVRVYVLGRLENVKKRSR